MICSIQFGSLVDYFQKPDDLYKTNKTSVKWVTISQLLKEVLNYQLCQGIKDPLVQSLQHQKLHIISKIFLFPVNSEDMMDISTDQIIIGEPTFEDKFIRSHSCNVLLRGIDAILI